MSDEPQIIFCRRCAVEAKTAWKKQHDQGIPDLEIEVPQPSPIYTYMIVNISGFPCLDPVCLAHLELGGTLMTDISGLLK